MNRQPQLMDATRMRNILTPHLSQMREHIFMNSELAMVRGDSTVFSLLNLLPSMITVWASS